MKIYETFSGRTAQFKVFGRDLITVYQYRDLRSDEWNAAGINWSACGTVSIEMAREFTKVLEKASKLADKWTKERVK